jgi:hypothetical protein
LLSNAVLRPAMSDGLIVASNPIVFIHRSLFFLFHFLIPHRSFKKNVQWSD